MMAPAKSRTTNVTDRALRYRANATPPPGPRVCSFCGSKSNVEVGHVDGHEENGAAHNLAWTCRSCNVKCANAARRAGVGRLTKQYNPAGGAKSSGQWLNAVLSMKGESDAMTVPAAVEMIHATSHAKRSQYSQELWTSRRARDRERGKEADARWNPATRQNLWPFSKSKPVRKSATRKPSSSTGRGITFARGLQMARAAGYKSGNEGGFLDWLESNKLDERSEAVISRFRNAYDNGVKDADKDEVRKSEGLGRERQQVPAQEKAVSFQGFSIYRSGDGYKTSIDRGESTFDSMADAKRFISDEVKMRRNPDERTERLRKAAETADARFEKALKQEYGLRSSDMRYQTARLPGYIKDLALEKQRADEAYRESSRSHRAKQNSASSSDRFYEGFHGRPPKETVLIEESEHYHENLASLGELLEMRVDLVNGNETLLSFEDDPPLLCSSEDGKQLYIRGGNQELDLKALGFGQEWIKDRMMLGRFSPPGEDPRDGKKAKWNIGYQTEKKFDNFDLILYQHDLGEETSLNGKTARVSEEDRVRPYLEYDPRNQRLFISGGQYFIKIPLVGVSPGIEQ